MPILMPQRLVPIHFQCHSGLHILFISFYHSCYSLAVTGFTSFTPYVFIQVQFHSPGFKYFPSPFTFFCHYGPYLFMSCYTRSSAITGLTLSSSFIYFLPPLQATFHILFHTYCCHYRLYPSISLSKVNICALVLVSIHQWFMNRGNIVSEITFVLSGRSDLVRHDGHHSLLAAGFRSREGKMS